MGQEPRDSEALLSTKQAKGERAGSAGSFPGPAAWPLHPVLFAAASVLALYASNLRETSFAEVLPALVAVTASAVLLFLAARALLGGLGSRAAVAVSIVIVAVLYHADLFASLNALLGGALPTSAAAPLTLLLAGALTLLTIRTRFDMILPNAILNGIAFVVFVAPAWNAASYTWETMALRGPATAAPAVSSAALTDGPIAAAAAAGAPMPDIYYFIFDRYGSEATLAREYGFDNRPFLDVLREKGFYLASESYANYPKTAPSLASTFHMDYLDFLADDPLARRNEWHPIYDMLENHRVGNFLKARGYRIIQIGSWWAPTQNNAAADENYSFGFSEFAWLYLRRTFMPILVDAVLPGTGIARMMAWDNGQCRRVPLQIQQVKAIAERPEPTFTFVHVLLPHEPYVFDANGNCLPREEIRSIGKRRNYVEQIRYANLLMVDVVESLIARAEKPIIILQADEGPYPEAYRASNRSWKVATPEELATKTGILNAYYFPDGDYSSLDQDITPVNTFRVLFDKYFGTSAGRLPDRIFAFPDYSSIYDFFDVTDLARQGNRPAD